MKRITVDLEPAHYERLKAVTGKQSVTISDFMRRAIDDTATALEVEAHLRDMNAQLAESNSKIHEQLNELRAHTLRDMQQLIKAFRSEFATAIVNELDAHLDAITSLVGQRGTSQQQAPRRTSAQPPQASVGFTPAHRPSDDY